MKIKSFYKKLILFNSAALLFYYNNHSDEPSYLSALARGSRVVKSGLSMAYYYYMKGINQETHTICSSILYNCLEKNGGCYIKLGQIIAQLEQLVPKVYATSLMPLFQNVKPEPFEKIEKILNKQYEGNYKSVFSEVDPIPIGVASLAQVHRGKLLNGDKVAIKVQHSRLLPESKGDVFLIKWGTIFAEKLFPEFKYKWLGPQFEINLLSELDFLNELNNAEKIREKLKYRKNIVIPKTYRNLSCKNLLIMSFEEGGSIQNSKYLETNKINVYEVARLLSDVFNEQIFKHGFLHADPHSGNIFVRKNHGKLEMVILDHGLYRTLSEEFRYNYSNFWRGVITQNKDLIKTSCLNMDIKYYELFCSIVLNKRYDEIMDKNKKYFTDKRLGNSFSKDDLEEISHFAQMYHRDITVILSEVKEEMLLLLKTNEFLRAIDRNLNTPYNSISNMVIFFIKMDYIYQELPKNKYFKESVFSLSIERKFFKLGIFLFNIVNWFKNLINFNKTNYKAFEIENSSNRI